MAFLDLAWQTFRPDEGFYHSEVLTPGPLPIRTFAPVGYEPRYPYPLLVFLHGQGGNEEQILRLAPRLSRRNYICIGLRRPQPLRARSDVRPGFAWGPARYSAAVIQDYIFATAQPPRRNYH